MLVYFIRTVSGNYYSNYENNEPFTPNIWQAQAYYSIAATQLDYEFLQSEGFAVYLDSKSPQELQKH